MSKESWILCALNLIIKLAIRAGLATVISGARTFLDFAEAAGYFAVDEGGKGILNLLYAVGRLVTPGALTFWTDAVGQIAKEPFLLAASKAEAERKATNQVGTEQASKELAEIVQYAQDFGTISKESFKRTTKWGAKYFTHEKSYYPVPKSSVELRDVDLVKPCPAGKVDPNIEAAMKGTCQAKDDKRRNNKGQRTGNEERVDQDTNIPRAIDEVPRITFVDKSMLGVIAVGDVTDLPEQEDEFDTDSESDADNDTDITFSRFGGAIRAHFRLDL
ncbi:hypothetical protein AWC38_SpisGene19557 [Stylophora pistillata]|uniref:Uncharacterized protein n=1 Tax=Stylophora pistillata TaxID=50429 RepID=A0A2B4RIJ6_STYPI|nr:hypothetical protein AWC38_SpisGene19557 [Stylophora pistillata]